MNDELLKAQLKWVAEKVDKMDNKMDKLIQSHAFFKGKVMGAAAVIAAVVSLLAAWAFSTPARADNESPVSTIRNVYSVTPVTTSAYVQLSASLPNFIRAVQIFDSSGQLLQLALGAAGHEVLVPWVIMPGGQGDMIPMVGAVGQRLSIKAVSGTANSGEIDLNLYN